MDAQPFSHQTDHENSTASHSLNGSLTSHALKSQAINEITQPISRDQVIEFLRKLVITSDSPGLLLRLSSMRTREEMFHGSKYVLLRNDKAEEGILALPIREFPKHAAIAMTGKRFLADRYSDLYVCGGGFMKLQNDELCVCGYSKDFGHANHERIVGLIKQQYPGLAVVAGDPRAYYNW